MMRFLDGGGDMGARIRSYDWAATPIGTPDAWPQALATLVSVMLGATQPMFTAWGGGHTMLYNDAYAELLGVKHPAALGRSFDEVWAEAMADLDPLLDRVFIGGEAIHMDDIALVLDRGSGPSEAHFDFSYTPVRDARGEVAGLFCACRETTAVVDAERRRREEIERQRQWFDGAPGFVAVFGGPDHVYEFANQTHQRLFGNRHIIGKGVRAVFPDTSDQGFHELLDRVYTTGERFVGRDVPIQLMNEAQMGPHYIDFIYAPIIDASGKVTGVFCEGFDVTEQHRAREALVRSEARFRAAIDAVRGILWTNSPSGEMLGEQPGWAKLTGQSRSEYEGHGWADAIHPDDARPTIDAWRVAVNERRLFEFEHRVRRADAEWRRFDVRAIPTFGEDGAIVEWIGVHTDITDERAAQEALRESEANYRFAVELHPQVTWTATPDGQLDRVADRWREWTGTTGLGTSWGEGLHPDDLGFTTDAWLHSVATGDPYDVEHRVKRVDGSFRWARSRAFARHDDEGVLVRWYGSTEDIDDRKAAEVRAFEAARELQGVVEALPGFVWTAAADGSSQYVSPTWFDYSGMRPEDAGREGWVASLHPDDYERAVGGWKHSLATGDMYEVEYRLKDAHGVYHWWLARARLQRESGNWIGTATELDAIVAAREALARSREELEAEVTLRTAELRETEEQLRQSQKLEAIGQLTGGVAHDFNNLLTVIRGSVDLLRRPGLAEDRRDRYVDAISDTVTRAAKLTGQLLAFARRQALQPEVFDVGEAVQKTREMIGTLVGSRIMIEIKARAWPYFVDADPAQFDTAIVNLAANARDAMNGEGTLTIELEAVEAIPSIRSHPAIPGRFLALSVRDTGTGIPADRLDQIFEPFFTTKGVGQGTGLGLSQIYGFAKQSGGEIRVTSAPGEGATFTLYLPRTDRVPQDEVAAVPDSLADGHGTCVLVVEDNEAVGQFARATLTELGYRTTHAPDGESALKLLAESNGSFDVVFSDVVMPGMNGVELARTVRDRYPDLPVVLTSGYSNVLAQEGADGFELLRKPYSMEELSHTLRTVVSERGTR